MKKFSHLSLFFAASALFTPITPITLIALIALIALGTAQAHGQGNPLTGMGTGPRFDGHMAKLFGEHRNFACSLDVEATPSSDRPDTIVMPARLAYSDGKSRLDIDLTRIRGSMMPPGMIDQIKALGMAELAIVTRPDNGSSIIVYPTLKSFAPISDIPKAASPDKFTLASTELGKESVDGMDCVKNKVTVTGPDGKKFEATVWNARQLKSFPVRVRSTDGGVPFTLTFRNLKFERPAASLFDMPAAFKKYDDAASLMREVLMKKQGEAKGAPK